jgi:hypothetical protein
VNELTSSECITPRRRWRKDLAVAGVSFLIAVAGISGWWHYTFPFGYSHTCSKGLGSALRIYAEAHSGWLPHGGATPEASLGLLAEDDPIDANWVLGGKNVRPEIVRAIVAKKEKFGPETCGWHYVEGLREDDEPRIMVAWDKVVGLGHNGERRRRFMHEVVFLDGSIQFVTKSAWPQFLVEQRERLAKMMASRQADAPPIRWSDEASLGPNPKTNGRQGLSLPKSEP